MLAKAARPVGMRVLIVGGRSFIGRRIFERLSVGNQVTRAGRGGRGAGVDLHLDLAAPGPIGVEHGLDAFDAIVHCAGSFGGNDPDGSLENELVNAEGAQKVGHLAARTHCRVVINVSTISMFADGGGMPVDSYGLSKRHGQHNLEQVCDAAGIRLCCLCPGGVYDERGEGRVHQPLFYRILECARRGEDFPLYGRADPLRNFIFVEELVTIVERALAGEVAGTYAVLFPTDYRVREIAELAFQIFGRGGRVVAREEMPDLRAIYLPHDGEIYRLLGFRPTIDLKAGLRLVRDHLEEGNHA